MCGEKTGIPDGFGHRGGSPPRVRGKAPTLSASSVNMGITPACAGKSELQYEMLSRLRDHPRVCGEKSGNVILNFIGLGSPPRVRGKVRAAIHEMGVYGITPACAGKRGSARVSSRSLRDHPRVCGEKTGLSQTDFAYRGSPPRVRGKAEIAEQEVFKRGITPACAGKSFSNQVKAIRG